MSKRPVMKHSKQMNNLDDLQIKIQVSKIWFLVSTLPMVEKLF